MCGCGVMPTLVGFIGITWQYGIKKAPLIGGFCDPDRTKKDLVNQIDNTKGRK